MSAQGDCEFLVQRARELVQQDLWAAKAWLITARSLYPADFNIQYEMYTIERNAERTATAGRLLYDMFVNFPDQPVVWREISIITSALRNDSQDKQTQFLRSLFETLPGRVQCEMLLKVTEQCFNTLERSEMLLLLLRRFPETVVQHGVGLGEALLEAETIEEQESPVNCFRKLFVCDVLPLIINNHDVRLPANLLYKYLNKAAEFYINYVTRSTQIESQHQGTQEASDLMSPSKRSSQKYIIEGLTEKSSQIVDPWERLFKILNVVGMRCEWQMDKGRRSYGDILHRMKDLCRYMNNFDNEAHAKYKNQVVYSTMLVFFKNAFQYVNSIQPSLFQGPNAPSQVPLVLLEDVSNVYGDVEIDRNKHIHKKRKLAEGREKTMQSSDDEDCSAKGRNRHIIVNKAELANSIEVLDSFKLARESWELLYSLEFLDKEFTRICLAWKTDTWLWLRIFLTDMIIYQMTCEKVLDLMCYMVLPIQDGSKSQEEPSKIKPKFRKGSDLKLLPCTSKAIMPYCLHLMLACFKLRAFTDSRDDMALGHVIVLLQQEWPRGENLFLKAVNKICQQGNFQYENFFNYVTNIDMLEEFAYLRTQEGGKIHLELLPNQGMLIKPSSPPMGLLQQEFLPVLQPSIQTADRHHTVTRGITKGVKEDFRLAMERQVSRCGENLMVVLHRFCINEKILLLQTLA
ncbi:integrator complex subunit 10 isoform X5 [Vulpes vulpes]|uniref:Integrator complex subunit 10 n=1 Tax=Vulpes vulpes TaxID=9627 RepID=A0ABM5AXE3_VULVU|nr:integrator complex subunit 10 isoform X6 [Canis lupus familiaris]XP_025301268.1 integrator complex subunit 10 isoform X6 [Canis lupus dingo]XP_025849488.1 integrator complex subunit 10 isoform X5 [Vulpes vulpes]XP_038415825.1 integrator complex subunit 10 isoform X6 [Canis lupus familiaris]XP_038545613.1 integrator complex subunit 10 isoform X6 [Canis lupus familiaris]XP_041607370.1 integrator complex subunit 10 isoform X5 [Vulpes lagopus]|eukprot:XP_005629835.1 integrator complex subunit 10 isoform X6 [Canis lupus familiaris]